MSAFGSHHMANPRDMLYSGEIVAAGYSSDTESSSYSDLESGGVPPVKLHSGCKKKRMKKKSKGGRDCRICHLALEDSNGGFEDGDDDGEAEEEEEDVEEGEEEEEFYGLPLQLGCSCKGDLGIAHRKCAETWFKIKGNLTCEICGSMALNVAAEQSDPGNTAASAAQTAAAPPLIHSESQGIWHGRRVVNFLLAGMVLAFIISWLFHFKVLR